jgi:UDP-N-acetylglucosamine:LPS N-acetylglucosamine transferase
VKVLFVCSSGGHLAQLHALESWWQHHERGWVTFDSVDATSLLVGERVIWAHHPTTRNLMNALRNLRLAVGLLRRDRPNVVISDGAGVAVPFFLVAKALRIATVYVEVYDRIDSRTVTGRLCAPMTDLFCVQWEEQLELYRGSTLIGPLL